MRAHRLDVSIKNPTEDDLANFKCQVQRGFPCQVTDLCHCALDRIVGGKSTWSRVSNDCPPFASVAVTTCHI